MGQRKDGIVYLDTHVVMWLYDALKDKLSNVAITAIENNELRASWMVKLEIQYLYELGRIIVKPEEVFETLGNDIGLKLSHASMENIINKALGINWTRDTFDRMIVAEALTNNCKLITKDGNIRKNYKLAIW